MKEWLECVTCKKRYDVTAVRYACDCGGLPLGRATARGAARAVDQAVRRAQARAAWAWEASGVWRFREALMTVDQVRVDASRRRHAALRARQRSARYTGVDALHLKHEGENPTGSFKDRGMTMAITQAARLGATAVACASTGNTSASLAGPTRAQAGKRAIVFLPHGKVVVSASWRKPLPTARCACRCAATSTRPCAWSTKRRKSSASICPQLEEPVPHRGAEDDRVGDVAGPRLASARLDQLR